MATAKYNWQEIKQKYFESPELEVEGFLREFLRIDPKKRVARGYLANCVGWRKEKEQIFKEQTEKAKKELENDPQVKLKNEGVLRAINNLEARVAILIGKPDNLETYTLDDLPKLRIGWEMLRISQNMPTSFVKNDNNNNFNIKEFQELKDWINGDDETKS
jgi:hypothetical protein